MLDTTDFYETCDQLCRNDSQSIIQWLECNIDPFVKLTYKIAL